jgi:DUF4097 and DUF4098 domain-containing protein YvlB
MFVAKMKIHVIAGFMALLFCTMYVSASPQFEGIDETGIEVLEVEASLLDVEIIGVSGTTLTARGDEIPNNMIVKYKRRGNVLRVWAEKRFFSFKLRNNGSLYFEVPGNTDLNIRTSSGEVVIRNMASESVSAESSSGMISISNILSDLRVNSSSGDVNIGMVEGNVRAESSSGQIEIIDVSGAVTLSSSSGDLRLSSIDGAIEASSSSGRVTLEAVNGTVDLQTSSGNITGADVLITGDSAFESSSGRIDIDFSNQLNEISFRLKSSSGMLEVGNLRKEKQLAAGEGAMKVTGESSSGNQAYR